MKDFKGTPAPWFSVDYCGQRNIQSTHFYENTNILDEEYCHYVRANETLICSAPDLLKSLNELVKTWESLTISLPLLKNEPSYLEAIKVINKAIGL